MRAPRCRLSADSRCATRELAKGGSGTFVVIGKFINSSLVIVLVTDLKRSVASKTIDPMNNLSFTTSMCIRVSKEA